MELRCLWTVRGLRKSFWATCGLVSPSATSPSTSTSRGVSPTGCSDTGVESCSVGAAEEVMVEGSSSERAYSNAASIRHCPTLLPKRRPCTLVQLRACSDQVGFFQRAQGRLQGHTPSFAQHLRGTEEPGSLLEFSFGSSVAGQSFQEDWGAQRSSQFFGECEALFV